MIEVRNLYKKYKQYDTEVNVLSDISIKIGVGEFVAIEGQSGSGKSTLLSILGLINSPTSGEVKIDGLLVDFNSKDLPSYRNKNIGFVFQNYQLLDELNVIDNCLLPVRYSGSKISDYENEAKKLLDRVGLSDYLYSKPNQISGGQQQRVAIARSLIMNPKLILADEPAGNLDKKNGLEIMELLEELKSEQSTSIVMVTHNPEHAKMADRSLYIDSGKLR